MHDGAKNAAVKAVFVRLRTHDGATYVRSSFWLPLQSVWTPSKRASRCGNAGSVSMLAMPPLILFRLRRFCAWAPATGGPKGPTAGVSVYSALRWWRVTLGVPLLVNDELLRSFRQLSVLHTPRSALVLLLLAGAVPCPFGRGPPSALKARRHRRCSLWSRFALGGGTHPGLYSQFPPSVRIRGVVVAPLAVLRAAFTFARA